jgi:hypothetical protein
VINAIDLPPFRISTSLGTWLRSLCSWMASALVPIPKCRRSLPLWRVSSAAIRSASDRVRTARGDMSSRLPIGVATTYSVPELVEVVWLILKNIFPQINADLF